MILKIRENIENFNGSAKEIWRRIEVFLNKEALFLNYLQINETEINDDFEEAIAKYEGQIEKIEVFALTLDEVIKAFAEQVLQAIKELHPRMEKLSDEYYSINRTIDAQEELVAVLNQVYETQLIIKNLEALGACSSEMQRVFLEIMRVYALVDQALKDSDSVYLADLLHFELIPLLTQLEKELEAKI